MTKEEFIKRVEERYGKRFTFEKTVYKNYETKVIITDENGNDITVTPSYFMRKGKFKNKKFDTENLIKRSKEIFGEDTLDYSKTHCEKGTDVITLICKKHGEFTKRATVHIHQKQGCPKCQKMYQDTQIFIEKARKIHGNKYDYSKVEYVNNHTKVCIICPEHGEFWQTPAAHLKGGCNKCRIINKRDTIDNFIEKSNLKERKIELIGEFVDSGVKTIFKCLVCGDEWEAYPYKITKGRGCPMCGHKGHGEKGTYTTEQFVSLAKKIHGLKYDYSKVEYINCDTPVCIICPIHGEFWQTPSRHLHSNGCIKCNETKLERSVRIFCEEHNIEYFYQVRNNIFKWLDMQSLDFYLPEYNIAIECQGVQHFHPVNHFGGEKNYLYTIEQDKIKYKKCKENNIILKYFTLEKFLNENYIDRLYSDVGELLKI